MFGLDHLKGVIVHGFGLKCHRQTGKLISPEATVTGMVNNVL